MRSPSKDFFMNIEESSKEDLWDYDGGAFGTNEPNTVSSSLSISERVLQKMEENPDLSIDQAVQEVTMNDAAEKLSKSKKQTARKSVARGNLNNLGNPEERNTEIKIEPNLDDDSANISAKVLHFFCQKCKNGIRYSPNDLQKHFLICHNGELPLYPCEMCNFTANDFQEFKEHRKTHRSTLVKCEICNNDYLYTLLGLTKHFTVMHCINGHFNCSKCRFSTRDVGTFVQHIHRHNGIEYACQKCNHISFSKIEFQRHLQGHSTMLPFSCQYCSYSAMRKDFIVKHVLARHREHVHTRDDHVLDNSKAQMVQASAGPKLGLQKHQTDKQDNSSWRQGGNKTIADRAGDHMDTTGGFPYKSSAKNQSMKDFTGYNIDNEQSLNDGMPSVTTIKCSKEEASNQGSMGLLQNAVHGPTVLMVKNNKITVPANYSATFVGYKMVNGKQNLVIKLLPTNKQSTNTSQPTPRPSNSLPRFSQGPSHGSYGAPTNTLDNRLTQSHRLPSTQTSQVEKQTGSLRSITSALGSLMARKNESKINAANRQQFPEPQNKSGNSIPNSSGSDFVRKIKKEPEEYNINEQQFFGNDHNYESPSDRKHPSTVSSSLSVDPTTGFLYRPRHNSESSGTTTAKQLYGKDLNSSMLHASTASGLGNFSCTTPNFIPKNDFAARNVHMNDRLSRSLENKPENIAFMPRITSVFSLQNRPSDPKPVGKNTYLHNMLQDNKRVNDKTHIAKAPNSHANSNTFPYTKQTMSSPGPKFDSRLPNGNATPSSGFLKQEPESPKSLLPTRVSELLKTHSDAIVNQQLAKDKMCSVTRASSGPNSFHLFHNPQVSGMSHSNALLYPSGSNRFVLPVVPNHQSGMKMISSQANAPSTATYSSSNRFNAPFMLNTRPGMVLTIANGPFGTIRNMTNGGSQVMGAMNNIGKMPLPRLQRPTVPHILRPNLGMSSNNVPANIVSGSSVGSKLPINLNVLQYCINADSSRATGNVESNKQQNPDLQKQPVYAILPDGKQAVLFNYVLPKNASANAQNSVQLNRMNQKLLPKKPDNAQQAAFLSKNQDNIMPSASVKEEDTDALEGYGGNTPSSKIANSDYLRGRPVERKPYLRSCSSAGPSEEHLQSSSDDKTLSQPSAANSKVPKPKCKQSNLNAANAKGKSLKRKASADSSSYEADFEFKTKKKVGNFLPEVPRKKMLHRKCKAKSYTSEVESLPDIATSAPKETVRTLRLHPLSSNQLIKYPQMDQPVVVLNHPDADVPEVINVMRTISKFNGHVLKVSLSKRTLEALLESKLLNYADGLTGRRHRRSKPVSPVKERFVLKLTLKKTSKNNYKIVKNTPTNKLQTKFSCWFCGRIFDNQDEWVGHGQRHLMEATKDWNTLF